MSGCTVWLLSSGSSQRRPGTYSLPPSVNIALFREGILFAQATCPQAFHRCPSTQLQHEEYLHKRICLVTKGPMSCVPGQTCRSELSWRKGKPPPCTCILVITRVDGDICLLIKVFLSCLLLGWSLGNKMDRYLSHTSAEQSDVVWVLDSS